MPHPARLSRAQYHMPAKCLLLLPPVSADHSYDTQDCLFDLAWSELHANQVLVAAGDGSIKLFDLGLAEPFPVQAWREHHREVFAVNWNLVDKSQFCSSSWDGSIRIVSVSSFALPADCIQWSPSRSESLMTLPTHSCTYNAAFSPHDPALLSAVCSDSHVRLFDLRTPNSAANHLTLSIPVHGTMAPAEVLTHDWNKYRGTVLATGSVDNTIKTFDIRAPQQGPLAVLRGHDYAVKKVAWSPHQADRLLSASYDMSCRVWTDGFGISAQPRQLGAMARHSEFAVGVDWCMFGNEGWAASVGWDERLLIWDASKI